MSEAESGKPASLLSGGVLRGGRQLAKREKWRGWIVKGGAVLVFAILYYALRGWLSAEMPALAVFFSLLIFLLPGLSLAVGFLPGESWIERVPLGLVLSAAVMSLPGIMLLALHGRLVAYLGWFIALSGVLLAIGLWLSGRREGAVSPLNGERLPLFYAGVLTAAAGLLFVLSLRLPLIGDDWVTMPWLWHFQTAEKVLSVSPYHGVALAANVRQEFFTHIQNLALMELFSGLEPYTFYRFLRPFLAVVGLLAFYSLARSLLRSERGAAFASLVWLLILGTTLTTDQGGYHLVVRIAQDKFFLRFVILPISLRLLLDYLHTGARRYAAMLAAAAWAAGATHPVGPVLLGLAVGLFAPLHLLRERNRQALNRLFVVGALLSVAVIIPLFQLVGSQSSTIAFSVGGSEFDPNILNRMRLATRAFRLWFFENGDYMLHPSVFWNVRTLLAGLCLPFVLWFAWREVSARLLLGMLAMAGLLYVPKTAMLLGRVVTPWLLWRLGWVPELAVWLILSGSAWVMVRGFSGGLEKLLGGGRRAWVRVALEGGVVVLLLGAVFPSLQRNALFVEDLIVNADQARCLAPQEALRTLAAQVESDVVVLAGREVNFCIPVFSPFTKVIEYRGTATLTRFGNDGRLVEGWQRLLDEAYFSAARLVDREFAALLDRYEVDFIFIEEERPLNLQLAHLPEWFEFVGEKDGFRIYHVKKGRGSSSIVEGNEGLDQRDWEKAREGFRAALTESEDHAFLGHLGLAQVAGELGDIDAVVEHLQEAVRLQPEEGLAYARLGAAYLAANRLGEAVEAFERASELMPDSVERLLQLAGVYKLAGRHSGAFELYDRAARLGAPVGSAHYFRLLGKYYASGNFVEEAIAAFEKGIARQPSDLVLQFNVGNLYLTKNDLQRAEATFQRALQAFPWNAEPRLGLGRVYEKKGEVEKAIALFQEAARLDPTNETPLLALTSILASTQDKDQVNQVVQRSLSYTFRLPSALIALAELYTSEGRYAEAVELYEKAMLTDPTRIGVYLIAKAKVLQQQGEPQVALANFKQALELGGAPDVVHMEMSVVFQSQGQVDDMLGQNVQAVLENPISLGTLLSLGKGRQAQGELEAAIPDMEYAIRLAPFSNTGYLALGDVYQSLARYEEASQQYQQAIRVQPASSQAYLKLGSVYQTLGRLEEARTALERAAQLSPDLAVTWDTLGNFYRDLGDLQKAGASFQRAIALQEDDISARLALSDVLIAQGDLEEARSLLQETATMMPDNFTTYSKLAELELQLGNTEAALAWLQQGVSATPASGIGYMLMADEYARQDAVSQAILLYEEAIKADPQLIRAYLQLASLYRSQGQYAQAEALYRQGVERFPEASAPLIGLGDTYLLQGKLDQAEEAYRQALTIPPPSASTYLSLANIYRKRGDWETAMQLLEESTQVLPEAYDAYQNLGDYALQRGKLDQAWEAYQRAVALNPAAVSSYAGLAQTARALGAPETARQILESALEANPDSALAHIALAEELESQGESEEAESHFEQAVQAEPENATAYLKLGQFYARQGKHEQAIEVYQRGLDNASPNTGLYAPIAFRYYALGEVERAAEWFRMAVANNPADSVTLIAQSSFYQSQGDFPLAHQSLQKALQLQPSSVSVHMALGNLYRTMGRLEEAGREFVRACELDRSQTGCLLALGDLYRQQAQWAQAIPVYRQAVELAPADWKAYAGLAQTYEAQGQFAEAQAALTQGIQHLADKTTGLLARAAFYERRFEWEKAKADYRAAWETSGRSQNAGRLWAQFLARRGEFSQALRILLQLTSRPDVETGTYLALGDFYRARAEWPQAVAAYRQAITADATQAAPYLGLAQVYTNLAQPQRAIDTLRAALDVVTDKKQVWLALGNAYLSRLDYPSAKEAFEQVLALDPEHTASLLALDALPQSLREGPPALEILEQRAAESPTPVLMTTLAFQYQLRGEWERALRWYREAVDVAPANAVAWLAMGNYYRNLQDWSRAEEALRKAVRYQPDFIPALLALGAVLERLEQGEAAAELYQQAIAIAPTQVGGYISLANLLMKQGDYGAAEETLRQARTMEPTSIAVYQTLGSLKTQMGEEQEAMQLYQQALEKLPGAAKFYVLQGNILEGQVTRAEKQVEIAKAALRKALFYFDLISRRLKPRNPVYRLKENDVFAARNNLEYAEMVYQQELSKLAQAHALYRQALMLEPANQDALLGLARIAAEMGDEEETLSYYRQTVALNPTSISGWMNLGNYYLELERPEEAIESFQAVLDLAPHFLGSQLGLVRAFRLLDAQQFDVLRAEEAAQYGNFLFQFTARRFRIRQLRELNRGS